jgi:hypothetical protein
VPVRLIWQAQAGRGSNTPRPQAFTRQGGVQQHPSSQSETRRGLGKAVRGEAVTRDRWEDGSRRLPGQRQARVCRSKVSCALGCLLNLPHGRVHGAAGCWAVRPARNTHHRSQGLVVRSFVPPFREAQQVQYGPERPAAYLIVKDSGKKNIYYSYFGSD